MSQAMIFIIGLVCGVLAYKVGKWRHSCIFWMMENPANVPLGWHKRTWQLGSWLIVTVLSLGFASCWAVLISNYVNEVIGMLSWGALLILRWLTSGIGARLKDQKILGEMNVRISSIRKEQKEARRIVQPKSPKGSSSKVAKGDFNEKGICSYCEGWGEVLKGKKRTGITCPHCSGTGWK